MNSELFIPIAFAVAVLGALSFLAKQVVQVLTCKDRMSKRFDSAVLWMTSVLFLLVAVFVISFLLNFSRARGYSISDSMEQWGQMGDFFGGMLNPILAFASFIALLYTIQIQTEELRLTREEFQKSVLVQTETSKAAAAQSDIASRQYLWSIYENLGSRFDFEKSGKMINKFPSANYFKKICGNSSQKIQDNLHHKAKEILFRDYQVEHQKIMDFLILLRVVEYKSPDAFVSRQIFKIVAREMPSDFLMALFFYYGVSSLEILGHGYVVSRFPFGEELLSRRKDLQSDVIAFMPLFFRHQPDDEKLFCIYVSEFDEFKKLENRCLETLDTQPV